MRVTTREHPAAEGGTVGEKFPEILPKCRLPLYILGSFTCRKATTWDRRLYFPSEGRGAEDFFALKIRRLRPGANARTLGTKGQHRSRLEQYGYRRFPSLQACCRGHERSASHSDSFSYGKNRRRCKSHSP